MVESPETTFLLSEDKHTPDGSVELADAEVLMIQQKPITSSIRSTVRHLHAHGGWTARWRGASLAFVYFLLHSAITRFVGVPMGRDHGIVLGSVLKLVASVLASVILARHATAWTHIVISQPSSKSWIRRMPNLKTFKNTWIPTVVADVAARLPVALPAICFIALGLDRIPEQENVDFKMVAVKLGMCLLIGVSAFIGLTIPAMVTLHRVHASMLPEEDESIVPFDRSFGGKVVPAIVGGSGAIGTVDAWKTFTGPARSRFLKLLVKFVFIEIALHTLFVLVLGTQLLVLIGPKKIQHHIKHGVGQ